MLVTPRVRAATPRGGAAASVWRVVERGPLPHAMCQSWRGPGLASAVGGMHGAPMAGDLFTLADPDLVVGLDIIHESGQRGGTCRMTGQAAMQADRHHLRLGLAFFVQEVERVLHVSEILIAGIEALYLDIAHIVGIQGVRDNQLRFAVDILP